MEKYLLTFPWIWERHFTWNLNLTNTQRITANNSKRKLVFISVYLFNTETVLNFAFSISVSEKSLVCRPSIHMSDRRTGSFTSSAPVMSKFSCTDRLFDLTEAFFSHPCSFEPDVTGVLLEEKLTETHSHSPDSSNLRVYHVLHFLPCPFLYTSSDTVCCTQEAPGK